MVTVFKKPDHRRMRDKALCPGPFECGAAQQRASFETGAVLRKLDERGTQPGPNDLDEAKAVHRRTLERLRQDGVNCRPRLLPRRLAAAGGKITADGAADVETADGARRFACPKHRQLFGRKMAIDVDQRHCRGQGYPEIVAVEP